MQIGCLMSSVHVLGNGPSVRCFEADLFHDEPKGIRVGCNIGFPHLNPTWNFMSYHEFIICALTNRKISTPVVTTREVLFNVREYLREAKLLDFLTTVDFYHIGKKKWKLDSKNLRMSITAGHSACIFAILLHKPTEIHLWGLDSLWTGKFNSLQDNWRAKTRIGKSSGSKGEFFVYKWWIEIFTDYPHIKFSIHAPTKFHNLPPNVQTILL